MFRCAGILGILHDGSAAAPSSYLPAPPSLETITLLVEIGVFAGQEFFEDVRALFGSLAFRVEGAGNTNNAGGGRGNDAKARAAQEVNLRILLDQLQVMKAEPRNQLRCQFVHATDVSPGMRR